MSLSPHTQEKKTEWKSLSKDMQEFVMRHALNQPEKLLSSQFKNMANALGPKHRSFFQSHGRPAGDDWPSLLFPRRLIHMPPDLRSVYRALVPAHRADMVLFFGEDRGGTRLLNSYEVVPVPDQQGCWQCGQRLVSWPLPTQEEDEIEPGVSVSSNGNVVVYVRNVPHQNELTLSVFCPMATSTITMSGTLSYSWAPILNKTGSLLAMCVQKTNDNTCHVQVYTTQPVLALFRSTHVTSPTQEQEVVHNVKYTLHWSSETTLQWLRREEEQLRLYQWTRDAAPVCVQQVPFSGEGRNFVAYMAETTAGTCVAIHMRDPERNTPAYMFLLHPLRQVDYTPSRNHMWDLWNSDAEAYDIESLQGPYHVTFLFDPVMLQVRLIWPRFLLLNPALRLSLADS